MCSSVVGSSGLYSPGFISQSVSTMYQTQSPNMFQLGLYINIHVQGYIQSYCVHYNLTHEHNGMHSRGRRWLLCGECMDKSHSVELLLVIH